MDGSSNTQLLKFMKVVTTCPVSINLGGFISLDRSLIVSVSIIKLFFFTNDKKINFLDKFYVDNVFNHHDAI